MPILLENVSLKAYNSFGIEVFCRYFTEINSVADFIELQQNQIFKQQQKLILGGGSNILFTKDFDGLVIKNNLKGIQILSQNNQEVLVKVAAGEVWHEFVLWCINNQFSGLENLSLIPGCVGASPMQNIGAYGVEIKDVFHELEAYSIASGERRVFSKEQCAFGYRESVFKHQYKNHYVITSVSFKLHKNAILNTTYGAINSELKSMGIVSPGIRDVSNAVISIRKSKLPDPKETGNAGSFFKNPEVTAEIYSQIKNTFSELVAYPLANGNYKLAAGWLIEQCGLKGFEINGAAVHTKQALVLINKNNCKGSDVFELSSYVLKQVQQKFGVVLEREVNIL